MSATRGPRDTRSAVDKALSLLGAFGEDADTGVGVSELARRASLSKSTAFRLLGTLERNGAVERAGNAYRIGRLIDDLATPPNNPAIEQARETLTPFLVRLYELTRQTVHMAVLDGHQVVYLNKLHGIHAVRAPSRIGGRAPAYCTAVGKVLLAYAPSTAEEVLAGELPQWTPHTITDPKALRRALAEARATGVAYDHEEILPGLNCIAAPVIGPMGMPVAALSVSGPTTHFDPRSQAHALRHVCYEASRMIGSRHNRERPTRGMSAASGPPVAKRGAEIRSQAGRPQPSAD